MQAVTITQIAPVELGQLIEDTLRRVLLQTEQSGIRNPPQTISKPITTQELCDYLNVTEPTVLRWRKKGKIPFFTIGSAVRYNREEVIKALSESSQKNRG